MVQLYIGQETDDVATSEAILQDPQRKLAAAHHCFLKRQFPMICVEISDGKHTSLSAKSFLSTWLHLLAQAYQIWSFWLENNTFKHIMPLLVVGCKKVKANRKKETLLRLSTTQKFLKLSMLAHHKSQAVQIWVRHYLTKCTDTLWDFGKVPAKTSPFCSRLVTGLCSGHLHLSALSLALQHAHHEQMMYKMLLIDV